MSTPADLWAPHLAADERIVWSASVSEKLIRADLARQRLIAVGTKERGHIKLNAAPRKVRAYPPFILFNAERPLELAEKIKRTLKIDQPIEDRTK